MISKALKSAAMLGLAASLYVACGDGDSTTTLGCEAGKVKCLNDKSGEVCSSDGAERLPFSCDQGEICATATGVTGCVGACSPGEKECASEAISRVCSADGKTWIPVACAPGTGCDRDPSDDDAEAPTFGTCVRTDDPTVTVCEPEEVTCADGQTVKACEQDGSSWVYTACLANELCMEGECVVDPEKRCTPNTGVCEDATHVKKCNDDGDSYDEPEACPGTTTCSDGACRGTVCTVDEVRCDDVRDGNVYDALAQGSYQPRAMYTCVDGESWQVTECAPQQVCAYTDISSSAVNQFVEDLKSAIESDRSLPTFEVPESSRATCQDPECAAPFALRELLYDSSLYEDLFFGSYACGDPRESDPSFIDSFSLCEGLPPYNNLHWANYACPSGSECSYTVDPSETNGAGQAPVCQSTCTDGDVRCYDSLGESTIECNDGYWDPATITPCADGSRELWCRRNLTNGGANYTQATCQNPACVIWQDEFQTFVVPPGYGACADDGNFYECRPDGSFGDGVSCPTCVRSSIRAPGVVVPEQTPSTFAGYQPGYCLPECVEGEQRCLDIGSPMSAPSPFYYTCDAEGHWTIVASCAEGKACRDVQPNPESPRQIDCGGECFEGDMQCVDEDGNPNTGGKLRQVCNDEGQWGDVENCPRGACTEDDQGAPGRNACEDECIPSTQGCTSDTFEIVCSAEARYGDPVACQAGTACLASVPEVARFGCIECIPATLRTTPDSRCSGSLLQVCGPNGTWSSGAGTTCPLGCTGAQAGSTVPGVARATCITPPMGGSGGGGAGGQAGGGAAGAGGAGAGGAGAGAGGGGFAGG
jgi:hypothetical protein